MFCSYCGNQITGNENFCPKCGKPLNNSNGEQSNGLIIARKKSFSGSLTPVKASLDGGAEYTIPNGQTVTIPIQDGKQRIKNI